MVIDLLLKDKLDALAPLKDCLAGKITHIDALSGIFSQMNLSQQEFDKFISSIEVTNYCFKKKIMV